MLTISPTTPTFLSTESPRHKSFPLSSHPTDAFTEACRILHITEPLDRGEFCSLRFLRFQQAVKTSGSQGGAPPCPDSDAYLSLLTNLSHFCQE